MIFSTKTTLSELLKEGFSGRAIPVANAAWHTSFIDSLVVELEERTSSLSGPQFRGEAEAHMLYPVLEWATNATADESYEPGTITKNCYSLAAIYAIIHRVMRVMNFKDAVDAITADAVQNTPIVAYIKSTLPDDSSTTAGSREVWSKFWGALNDRSQSKIDDPVTLLATMMAGDYLKDGAQTPTQAIFNRITRYLRMGKGVAMLPSAYDTRLAQINQILSAVRRLQSAASVSEDASALTSDAFVLALGLCAYLDSIAQYDMDWDSSPLPFTRDAQPQAIKTLAQRMSGHYLWLSTVGVTADLQVAVLEWEQLDDFLKEALPESSAVSDLRHLWADKVRGPLDSVTPSLCKELVTATSESFKAWTAASHIIRPDWLPQIVEAINATPVHSDAVPSPDDILQATHAQLDDDHKFRVLGRPGSILPILQDYAAAISNLILGVTSMIDIVTCQGTMQYSKDATTVSTLPIHRPQGLLRDPAYDTFDTPAPYESVIEALVPDPRPTYAENNIRVWRYREIIFSPRMEIPYKLAQIADGAQLYWPYDRSTAIGTPSTAAYYVQPIPDCYTRTRCTSSLPFTFAGYEQAVRGVDKTAPTTLEYFETAATLLARYPGEQGHCIVDALSQVFAIQVQSDSGWDVQYPRAAFLYGAPAKEIIDHNLALPDEERGWYLDISVETEPGKRVTVRFTALSELPAPIITEQALVKCGRVAAIGVQTPAVGVYGGTYSYATILDTANSSAQASDVQTYLSPRSIIRSEQVITSDGIKGMTLDITWLKVKGYSQFTVALAAYSCVGRDRTPVWELVPGDSAMVKLAMCSVSKKWKPLSQTYELGIFVDDPLLLVTPDDYFQFMAKYSIAPPKHGTTQVQPEVGERTAPNPSVPQDAVPSSNDFTANGKGQTTADVISGINPSADDRKLTLTKTTDADRKVSSATGAIIDEVDASSTGAVLAGDTAPKDELEVPVTPPQSEEGYIVNDEKKQAKKAKPNDPVPDGWRFVTALPDGYDLV